MARQEAELGVFTPNQERSLLQLERVLEVERDSRRLLRVAREVDPQTRSITVEMENPSYSIGYKTIPEEPTHYRVEIDNAFFRGMFKISRSLYDNVIFDTKKNHADNRTRRIVNPERKAIADGIVEQYRKGKP